MARPTAIEVREVSKSFAVPERPPQGMRERLDRSFRRRSRRRLEVLRDISFDVARGESFAIVGRNGSGKSTLLKLLASIYRADRGRIRLAGRLAPFLELGVGFNNELAALDNVVLNGVMMGLTPAESRSRFEEIVDFAGLRDYTDLPLKNYSSGMKVRLGFAIMTHVDADVLLVDEVLAVGDAEFQERCGDAFRRMREEGRTMVLVTHNMPAVKTYCERGMLLHDGRIDTIGDTDAITNRYIEINLSALAGHRPDADADITGRIASALAAPAVRFVSAALGGGSGGGPASGPGPTTLAPGEPIGIEATVHVDEPVDDPRLYIRIDNPLGQILFVAAEEELGAPLPAAGEPGERLRLRATVENRLAPGRYLVTCAVLGRGPEGTPEPVGPPSTLSFDVSGQDYGGLVALEHSVEVEVESTPARALGSV